MLHHSIASGRDGTAGKTRATHVALLLTIASLLAGSAAVVSYSVAYRASRPAPVAMMALDGSASTPATPIVTQAAPRRPDSSAPITAALSPAGPAWQPGVGLPADAPASPADPDADDPPKAMTFDGRPLRKVRTVEMLTTAYSPDARSCGKWADGVTASGYSVWTNAMKLVAADTSVLPFGTIVTIPGYDEGKPVPVLDRGGAIKGQRLDLLYPTHEAALQWGAQRLEVTVWEYADR